MLTAIGITLNFIGSVVLLGTEVKVIKRILRQVDPIHYIYERGLRQIVDKSTDEEMIENNMAHPYNGPISVDHWSWWPLCQFLDRYVEQDIPRDAKIDIRGGWFEVNGEQLTFPEKRSIQLNEKEQRHAGPKLSLSTVFGLLYEARMKRVYIYGVSLLALGFLFQLVDSMNIFATAVVC